MKKLAILFIFALIACAGCRRIDYRTMTINMPDFKESDKPKIVEVLKKYNGIDKSSYEWNLKEKTLTLRYDSMQIAQANIRYAIDESVTRVAFPKKTDTRAGY